MKNRFFKSGIKQRITLYLFLAGFLPLVLGMTFTYLYGMKTIRHTIGDSFQEIASETAIRTDWVFQKEVQRLRDLSVSPDIQKAVFEGRDRYQGMSKKEAFRSIEEQDRLWKRKPLPVEKDILNHPVSQHLRAIVEQNKDSLMGILITDEKGALVATSSRPTQYAYGTDGWWQEARRPEKDYLHVSGKIAQNGSFKTNVDTLDIAVAILKPGTDQVLGVIKMCYNFNALLSVISGVRIGETGHAMLVDSEGTPLICPILPRVAHTINASLMKTIESDLPHWAILPDDAHGGRNSIAGFAPVEGVNRMAPAWNSGEKWYVFVRQAPRETYAPVYDLLWKVGILGTFLVGLVAFFGFYAGQEIVKPIETLQRTAKEMGEGNLDSVTEIRTGDEIETLYREFDQMARNIKASRERLLVFYSALNHTGDSVVITRPDGSIDYVNPAFTELTGYTAEDAIGNNPRIQKSGAVDPVVYKMMWEVVLSRSVWKGELINRRKDGTLYDTELTISPIIGPAGEIIQLVGISRDITLRKEMETNLRHYSEGLETLVQERTREITEAKAYLENLLENANDIIYTLDLEGQFTYVNPKIEEWGYQRDHLIGRSFLSILSDKHYGRRLRQCIADKIKMVYEVEGLTINNGGIRQAMVSISPLFNSGGEVSGVLGIARDITERKKMEEKLIESEKMTALGQMATMIAHEIRNPLSSIKMNLQILSQRIRSKGDLKEHFSIALEEVGRLEELLRSILDYAKPPKPDLSWEDVHSVLEEALILAVKELQDKRVTVLKDYKQGLPRILIDKGRLKQAVLNLYLNATHAMSSLGELRIRTAIISRDKEKEWLQLEISDNGKGIPEKDLPKIFEPFHTSRSDGTGLGLTIVKRVVEEHRGKIEIQSQEGKGTKVTIQLPTS